MGDLSSVANKTNALAPNPRVASSQVDARNVDGSTPLCDACSAGSLECVRLLLEHGATANAALTSRTASPLHEACMGGYLITFTLPSPHLGPYMTVTRSPLFRKRRLREAADCSGCSSGGVRPLLRDPSARGVRQRRRGLRQSAAERRRVSRQNTSLT